MLVRDRFKEDAVCFLESKWITAKKGNLVSTVAKKRKKIPCNRQFLAMYRNINLLFFRGVP